MSDRDYTTSDGRRMRFPSEADMQAGLPGQVRGLLPPVGVPIAKELLQAERERLARHHYAEPIEPPRSPETCDDCARLRAIIAELKLLG